MSVCVCVYTCVCHTVKHDKTKVETLYGNYFFMENHIEKFAYMKSLIITWHLRLHFNTSNI